MIVTWYYHPHSNVTGNASSSHRVLRGTLINDLIVSHLGTSGKLGRIVELITINTSSGEGGREGVPLCYFEVHITV